MDTLSRKHRLRQQQQRRATEHQQQVHYAAKENQQQFTGSADYYLNQFQSSSASKRNYTLNQNIIISNNNNSSRGNSDDEEDEEEEQFKVFSLSANGQTQQFQQDIRNGQLPVPATGGCTVKCREFNSIDLNQQQIGRRRDEDADEPDPIYEQVDDDDDEQVLCSILHQYKPGKQNAAHKKRQQQANQFVGGPMYADCSTTESCSTNATATLKSTGGHSSGFLSAEESFGQVKARKHNRDGQQYNNNNRPLKSRPQQHQHQHEKPRRHLHERHKRDRLLSRSRVIDDLDRLMADADRRSNSNSPADSCLSCCDSTSLIPVMTNDDSKVASGNELDYSTLCRDEFSSFIAAQTEVAASARVDRPDCAQTILNKHFNQQHQQQQQFSQPLVMRGETRSGPMLIGVHDTNNNAPPPNRRRSSPSTTNPSQLSSKTPNIRRKQNIFTNSSRDSSSPVRSDLSESQHEFRSSPSASSELSTGTSNSNTDNHRRQESLMSGSDGELVLIESEQKSSNEHENDDNLSEMLDIYLNRVHCLLRLTSGDKSVSMNEAFDRESLHVSEENSTQIQFSTIERAPSSTKVVQEILLTGDDSEHNDEELSDDSCQVIINRIGSYEYKSLLSSMQTNAKLNWLPSSDQLLLSNESLIQDQSTKPNRLMIDENLVETREVLEETLIKSLLQKISDKSECSNATPKLIEIIRKDVNEFINNYESYQNQLKKETSFANDWHKNWLFAYKRPQTLLRENYEPDSDDSNENIEGFPGPKRARMSNASSNENHKTNNLVNKTQEPIDMLKYSTLILSKCKPIKLTYLTASSNCNYSFDIEHFYEAQQDQFSELYSQAIESSGKTDIIRLLLSDLYDEIESTNDLDRSSRSLANRPLIISYDSSSRRPICAERLSFSAYGYRFETPFVRLANRCDSLKLARLRGKILSKLEKLIDKQSSKSSEKLFVKDDCTNNNSITNLNLISGLDRVSFPINLTNVELINKLPIIQFCAKISGASPISVRWFKSDLEISDLNAMRQSSTRPRGLRARVLGQANYYNSSSSNYQEPTATINWPIEMCANYDYEYQNKWSSWYRFRRQQDQVLFEIRDANFEEDYNKTYKCVITNYCSIEECSFTLTQRQVDEGKRESLSRSNLRLASQRREENGHALLRTWSQRTLHKPVPTEQQVTPTGATVESRQQMEDDNTLNGQNQGNSWQQSIGRRSNLALTNNLNETTSKEEDKFGKSFPYHPENLLKRLQDNKYSSLLKCRRLTKTTVDPNQNSTRDYNQQPTTTTCLAAESPINGASSQMVHFTDSFEPLMDEALEVANNAEPIAATTDCSQVATKQQQELLSANRLMVTTSAIEQQKSFQVRRRIINLADKSLPGLPLVETKQRK